MRIWGLVLLLALGLVLGTGCKKEEASRTPEEGAPAFSPPVDGRITERQKEAYIEASRLLTEAIAEHEKAIKLFAKRHGLSEDLRELSDPAFSNEHPALVEKAEGLNQDWERRAQRVYDRVGLTEEEFTWIGGALVDSVNSGVQAEVAERLKDVIP
jgi:hypothetical protein